MYLTIHALHLQVQFRTGKIIVFISERSRDGGKYCLKVHEEEGFAMDIRFSSL